MLETSRKWGLLALALATAGALVAPVALHPTRACADDGIEVAEEDDPGQVYRGRGAFDFTPDVHYVAADGTKGVETCTTIDNEGCTESDVIDVRNGITIKDGWWLLDYSNVLRDTTIEVTGDAHFVFSGPVDLGMGHIHVAKGATLTFYVEEGREKTTSLTSSHWLGAIVSDGTAEDCFFPVKRSATREKAAGQEGEGPAVGPRTGEPTIIEPSNGETIKYTDADGSTKKRDKADFECDLGTFECEDARLNSAWYYVSQSNTINERVEVAGDAKIVLCPDATLVCASGIHVPEGSSLAIYSLKGQEGALVALGIGLNNCAGIGGNEDQSNGPITICGGNILAKGGKNGAGIGGGDEGHGNGVTIYDGTVTAKGGEDGAGIGGGCKGIGGRIDINGGEVNATGNEYGAGIGGGRGGEGGTITIRNGDVHAQAEGYTATFNQGEGAAIGGGDSAGGGNISILGGCVSCEARSAASIGGGYGGAGGKVSIRNASVSVEQGAGLSSEALGVGGAGIGSGYDYNGTNPTEITIEDSNVDATAINGAAIGSGYCSSEATITIRNSRVNAQSIGNGAGIGGGKKCTGGKVTIGGTSQVTAVSNTGSGIGGGCDGDGGTVDISGDSTVEAHCVRANGGAAVGRGCGADGVGTVRLSDNLKVTDLSDNVGMVATFGEREGYCLYRSHAKIEPGESRK